MTNKEFFKEFAKPATIGLVGGSALIDKSIRKAQKFITPNKLESYWSHAFIVNEIRQDKEIWIIESDLEFHSKQIKLGVQENRISKYYDEIEYPNVAILNFNLSNIQIENIIGQALNLVALKTQYSIREVFGVLYNTFLSESRLNENKFKQNNSLFCSAFVQNCYNKINLNLNSKVNSSQLAPHDIYLSDLKFTLSEIIRAKT